MKDLLHFILQLCQVHFKIHKKLLGNGKIVKKLLIKGCDKNVKNKKNQTALDLAIESDFKNIVNMLSQKNNCLISYLNVRMELS